ncbi:MAG: ATP-binding protein [Parvularculaceae bacterium]
MGLGLPLVNAIVAAHDGRFRIDSEPGKGTSAYIVLPAHRVRRAGAEASSAA